MIPTYLVNPMRTALQAFRQILIAVIAVIAFTPAQGQVGGTQLAAQQDSSAFACSDGRHSILCSLPSRLANTQNGTSVTFVKLGAVARGSEYSDLVFVFDGIVYDREADNRSNPYSDLRGIDIVSIRVLQGEAAIREYGHQGRSGVVFITTNRFSQTKAVDDVRDLNGVGRPYPNPATQVVNLPIYSTEADAISLTIYDVLGRALESRVESSLGEGVRNMEVDVSDMPAGTYLYRVTIGTGVATQVSTGRFTVAR